MKRASEILNEYNEQISSQFGMGVGHILQAMERYADQFKPRKTADSIPTLDGTVLAWDEYGIMKEVFFDDALPNSFKNSFTHWMPIPKVS